MFWSGTYFSSSLTRMGLAISLLTEWLLATEPWTVTSWWWNCFPGISGRSVQYIFALIWEKELITILIAKLVGPETENTGFPANQIGSNCSLCCCWLKDLIYYSVWKKWYLRRWNLILYMEWLSLSLYGKVWWQRLVPSTVVRGDFWYLLFSCLHAVVFWIALCRCLQLLVYLTSVVHKALVMINCL